MAVGLTSGSPGTLTLWLQNRQGSYTNDPTPFFTSQVVIARRHPPQPGEPADVAGGYITRMLDSVVAAVGDAQLGSSMFFYSISADHTVNPQQIHYLVNDSEGLVGVIGCDWDGALDDVMFVGRTCPRDGLDGWITMTVSGTLWDRLQGDDFTNPRPLEWRDVAVTVGGCAIIGANSGFTAADFDLGCVSAPYETFTATPEPATVALLGGGLALLGVGGVVRLRRGTTSGLSHPH